MQSQALVLGFEDCTRDCAQLVGGKATGLGALLRERFQVPPGFAITTVAYHKHVARNGLSSELERVLANCTTYDAQLRASEQIRNLFDASVPPPEVADAICRAYTELSQQAETPVAVRSSATNEDSAAASFAGQQETYLWIIGERELLRHVVRCWASLFTAQALAYRTHLGTDISDLGMGVVVQRMVAAEAAGVLLTLDPITGDGSTIVIEGAYGLGAAVVNGEVTPDHVTVDKTRLAIRTKSIGDKSVAYRFDPAARAIRLEDVARELRDRPCFTDAEIVELARLGKQMEQAMGRAQDIEWAIGPDRQIFLLQARPETVWSQKATARA